MSLPSAARLHCHPQSRFTSNDSQAGISGKNRRMQATSLWVCLMGVTDKKPDKDPILQSALQLDIVNHFLCNYNGFHATAIAEREKFIFRFDAKPVDAFKLDVSTNVHRLMCHFNNQLIDHGCIFRASEEENDSLHKLFKVEYSLTNSHIDQIGPKLIQATLEYEKILKNPEISRAIIKIYKFFYRYTIEYL